MMRCLFVVFLLLLSFASVSAGAEVPQVVVYGTAQTEVVPDELQWSIFVRTEGALIAGVTKEHVAEVSAVLDALQSFGLAEKDVETSNMQLQENWAYRSNSRVRDGYYAYTGITFKLKDFNSYASLWERLTALKNVSVANVNFALSNREEVSDLTKIEAIKAGREKAKRFAAELGREIGEPLLIEEMTEGGFGPQPVLRAAPMMSEAGGGQPISSGREVVTSRVKLVFALGGK